MLSARSKWDDPKCFGSLTQIHERLNDGRGPAVAEILRREAAAQRAAEIEAVRKAELKERCVAPPLDRVVARTVVRGVFGLPIGIRFLSREPGKSPGFVEVSTVCLDDNYLEDPLGVCERETGYETMVFLETCTFFSVFTAKYETREEAAEGHKSVVQKLLAKELPLAIVLGYYSAWEATDSVEAAR